MNMVGGVLSKKTPRGNFISRPLIAPDQNFYPKKDVNIAIERFTVLPDTDLTSTCPMAGSSPITWDEKHVKALLGLRQYPTHMLQDEPWRTWIEEHGGEKHLIEHLRSSLSTPETRQLFDLLFAHPQATTLFYAEKLYIGHSSYFVVLKNLIQALLVQLNQWGIAPPEQKPSTATNLPTPLSSLIGTRESVQAVVATLKRPDVRLLTLTGPGGVGKTRLAIAAGRELLETFRDGVFFVPLETVYSMELLITQVARSLNMESVNWQPLLDTINLHLAERRILLIFDNFEQLTHCADVIVDLLERAANLKILVTSRETLNIYGEIRYVVPELRLPDPDNPPLIEEVAQWSALDLFIQRVQARHPSFFVNDANLPTIMQVCYFLEGLPLAIELAAAQVRLLPPDQTLTQLEYGLRTLQDLSRNRSLRQQTLWETINWSYQLLSEPQKAIFRQLSVFGREWSLKAAQSVCQADDLLASLNDLTDKSLLRYLGQGEEGDARFQMLQPLREFALERLSGNLETEQAQRRHAAYFLEMSEHVELSFGTPDQPLCMRRIKQERENLQIALGWMLDQQETEMAFRLLGSVWRYYSALNIWDETRFWMDLALAQGVNSKSAARAKTLWGAYWLSSRKERIFSENKIFSEDRIFSLAEEGLRIARELEDHRLVGLLLHCMVFELRYRNQYDKALEAAQESLRIFQALGDQVETAWTLGHISGIFSDRGDWAKSQESLQESLVIFRVIGDEWSVAQVSYELAGRFWQLGDFEQVKNLLEESLALSKKLGDQMGLGWALNFQGRLALQQLDLTTARKLFEEARAIFEKLGDPHSLLQNRTCLEQLASLQDDQENS